MHTRDKVKKKTARRFSPAGPLHVLHVCATRRAVHPAGARPLSGRLLRSLLISLQTRHDFLAIAVQFLSRRERALEQNGQVMQNAFAPLLSPAVVETDLLVEPALEPLGI